MSSSDFQSIMLGVFYNRSWGKAAQGCEKREYLLSSLLDWREQPDATEALWRKPAGSLHRSEA